MTEILVLLLVVVFSLILIRHGRKKRKISILLFGVVLLFALPLSMYKESDRFRTDIDNPSSYNNQIKKFDLKELDISLDSDDFNKKTGIDEELSIDREINYKKANDYGKKILDTFGQVSKVKNIVSKDTKTNDDKIKIVKSASSVIKEIGDFFEFIRGSNLAAVEINKEAEVIVLGSNFANDKSKDLELHIIDVGQGDSLLIKKGEFELLIDAGPNEEGENVVKYLKGNFVKEIDLIIATHPHEDHIGGLDVVIDNFPVKRVIDSGDKLDTKTYRDYMTSVKASRAELVYDNNLVYDYGDIKVQIIELGDNYENTNENSVVSVISYKDISILAAGDLEENLEDELMQILRAKNIDIDIYKASHHGSKTSNSKELLAYIKPEVILISAGKGNKYKHPNKDAIELFLEHTDRVYSTHKSGNLKFIINDKISESKDYYNLKITDSSDFR